MRRMNGGVFKLLLERDKISIKEIAEKSGLSYLTVWKYANERVNTRYATRDDCAGAYLALKEDK